MSKKQVALIIIITSVLVWTADLLFGNYLSALLATSSFARKYNLFNPQAPIVVTNRETVRVNNSSDVVQTAENAKSKISSLVYYDNSKLVNTGTAINWTSDGYFITTKSAMQPAGKVFAVVTLSGDVFPVETFYTDLASELVILKTSAQGMGVLDPANSGDLRVGQQLVSLSNAVGNQQTRFETGFVQRVPNDTFGAVSESDLVSRSVGVQTSGVFGPSSVILNLSGRMVGVWDGQNVISVEDVQLLVNNFLSDQKQIIRPSLGFSYQLLSDSESKILQTVSGARVIGVANGKPAALAGLKTGDVITNLDGNKITIDSNLDSILRQLTLGQTIKITVSRGGNSIDLSLDVGKL